MNTLMGIIAQLLLTQSQGSKYLTHNEALIVLVAYRQGKSQTETDPPPEPETGDAYIVAATATGAWAGHEDEIAYFFQGGWRFLPPLENMIIGVTDSGAYVEYDGTGSPPGWEVLGVGPGIGVFTGLTDTPNSYSGQGGKIVKVNGDENALEFVASEATDRSTVTSVSSSSGVVTLNYALGDYFTLALTENVTSWVISNPPGSGKGFTLMVQITQDSTPRTVAKPGTTAGGAALDVSTGSGDVDVLAITSFDNGSTLRSSIAKDFS